MGRWRGRRAHSIVAVLALVGVLSGCRWHPTNDTDPDAVAARRFINLLLDRAEAADAAGKVNQAREHRARAVREECLNFGCKPARATTTIAFDPKLGGGFFDAPWPSDTRLAPDGSLDLTGFPGRAGNTLVETVLTKGGSSTFGFGNNAAVYFRTTAAIDPASLPFAAESTVRPRSSIQLLNLDDPAAPPVPVLVDFEATGTKLRPSNLLTLLPYPGHPLDPGTQYAAVVFDAIRTPAGTRLAPSPTIAAIDRPTPAGIPTATWAKLRKDKAAVVAAVRARTLWHPSEIVAFTAFTTQAPTEEMAAVARAVEALPTPTVLSRTAATASCPTGSTSVTTGRVALPSWQQGTRPFVPDGGRIVVGGDGRAVQQGSQLGADGNGVIFELGVPCGPAPAEGWPIMAWVDGTGGSAQASPIPELGNGLDYAVISVAPLYSSDRLEDADAPFDTPEFQFFNWINPEAGRTNVVQQAGDVLYLARLMTSLVLPEGEAAGTVEGRFDADTVVIAGHSQGATSAPLTLAEAPDYVKGGFLSAGGAGLYHSVVLRGDVRPLVDGILGASPGELDAFHPYPQILQTFAEVGDAANYAGAIEADLVLYGGLRDGCTSIETARTLAQALGIPIVNPTAKLPLFGPDLSVAFPGYEPPFEPDVVTAPVSQNLPGGRTAALVEVDSGHFGASRYPAIGRAFVDSIAAGGPVTIDPGAIPPAPPGSQCPRFGPAPVP